MLGLVFGGVLFCGYCVDWVNVENNDMKRGMDMIPFFFSAFDGFFFIFILDMVSLLLFFIFHIAIETQMSSLQSTLCAFFLSLSNAKVD